MWIYLIIKTDFDDVDNIYISRMESMPRKKTNRTIEVWGSEKRSPIPYNSYEIGVTVGDSLEADETYEEAAKRLIPVVEQILDYGHEILAERLEKAFEEGEV